MNHTLERVFPGLMADGYAITSSAAADYNCIAWAAGEVDRWWWPDLYGYWPQGVAREATLVAFAAAFELMGYESCESGAFEPGFEKVVIYRDAAGKPTHAARQLPSGEWTSKLGRLEDITHRTPGGLEGQSYGAAAFYMRRPTVGR